MLNVQHKCYFTSSRSLPLSPPYDPTLAKKPPNSVDLESGGSFMLCFHFNDNFFTYFVTLKGTFAGWLVQEESSIDSQ